MSLGRRSNNEEMTEWQQSSHGDDEVYAELGVGESPVSRHLPVFQRESERKQTVWIHQISLWLTGLVVKLVTSGPKKRNAQGQVLRYKVRLVAQGFTQRPGVDYTSTYSPVMDSTTFRYLLGMAVQYMLEKQLLDVVPAYLSGPLHTELYNPPVPYWKFQLKIPIRYAWH